jgi:hypothetical protein
MGIYFHYGTTVSKFSFKDLINSTGSDCWPRTSMNENYYNIPNCLPEKKIVKVFVMLPQQ